MKNFMSNKLIKILLLFIVLSFSLGLVSAADEDFTALQDDINNAGDILILDKNYIYNHTKDSSLQNGVIINKNDFVLDGNGYTIDGSERARIFIITGTNVTIKNLNIINGIRDEGAAIYNTGSILIIDNCNFTNNLAEIGVIFNSADSFMVTGSTFTKNLVDNGVIYNEGNDVGIFNCIFTENTANGVIYNAGDHFLVTDSMFTKNTGFFWGAIFNSGNDGIIDACNFTENSVNFMSGDGGAIYNCGNNIIISGSIFTRNSGSLGGAIHNYCTSLYGNDVIIDGCTFIENSAAWGGAIYNAGDGHSSGDDVMVVGSTFTKNSATGSGGAIANYFANTFTVFGCTFNENSANNGGAIINTVGYDVSVIASNFTKNSAKNIGGTTFNEKGSMYVSGNIMSDNSAGLGQMIYNNGTMGVLNLTFLDNSTKDVETGQSVTLYATLTDDMGNTVTGQKINFNVNGNPVGSMESIEGYAALTYLVTELAGSIIPVTGSYNGNGNYPIVIKPGQLRITGGDNPTPNPIPYNNSINPVEASMKKTGMPILVLLLILLSGVGLGICRKQ